MRSVIETIRQTMRGVIDATIACNFPLAGKIAAVGFQLLLHRLSKNDAHRQTHDANDAAAAVAGVDDGGYAFELPLYMCAKDAESVWLLQGDDGGSYLPLFTDRDAAQTFILRSSMRPIRIVKITSRREAIELMRSIDGHIAGVVWDRLPGVRQSRVSSRQYVAYKLVTAAGKRSR